jgi:hypothetical protein
MTTKTLAELDAGDIRILDGDGVPSPIGQAAQRLQLGTLLAEVRTRLVAAEAAIAAGDAEAGDEAILDATGQLTGIAGVSMTDNLADAFSLREAANAYLTLVTTNDKERVNAKKLFGFTVQVIDMADAQVALVLGTAGAGQLKLLGNILFVDANSAGTEDLLLPPEADSTGLVIFIANTGGEDIILKDDGDAITVATISTTELAFAVCNGTSWLGGVVKLT